MAQLSTRIHNVAPSATLEVDLKAKALKASGIDIIGFGAGEPDFPTPDYILRTAVEAAQDSKIIVILQQQGLPELREAITHKTARDSGYEVDPQQIVVTNGGKHAVRELPTYS